MKWHSDIGETFEAPVELIGKGPIDRSPILFSCIADSISRKLWAGAAKNSWMGEGLQQVPELSGPRRQCRIALKRNDFKWKGLLQCVMTGATWCRQRLFEYGLVSDPTCPRCGQAPETDKHRCWECPANKEFQTVSSNLIAKARGEADTLPSLWIRGLIPSTWTSVPEPTDENISYVFGRSRHQSFGDPGVIFGGGDASGGKDHDPKLRRVAWAFATLGGFRDDGSYDVGELGLTHLQGGNLPGFFQTVNRGETTALIEFAAVVLPLAHAVYVTDSDYVMRGVEKIRLGKLPDTHVDLWRRLGETLNQNSTKGLRVIKVESHLSAEEALQQGVDPASYSVNSIADEAAKKLADEFRVSKADRCRVKMSTAVGFAVRKHLARVLSNVIETVPRQQPSGRELAKRKKKEEQSVQLTAHHGVRISGSRVRCTECGGSAPRRELERFLDTPCVKGLMRDVVLSPSGPQVFNGRELHSSHVIGVHQRFGTSICLSCGFYAQKGAKNLLHPCLGRPTAHGRGALSRLQKGEVPAVRSKETDRITEQWK